jgi:hypothetical protein
MAQLLLGLFGLNFLKAAKQKKRKHLLYIPIFVAQGGSDALAFDQ